MGVCGGGGGGAGDEEDEGIRCPMMAVTGV